MRRGWMRGMVGLLLLLPQRSPAQMVDGFRYTMAGTQTSALPGQPDGPRPLEVRGQVGGGVLRMEYGTGTGPFSRPGVFMLMDSRTNQLTLIDSTAKQSVSFAEGMSSALSGLGEQMVLSDTASKLEDLGAGDTVVGYPTRKYRLTVKYSMGMAEMPEVKTSMVQITTLQVSEAVAALDPAFALATSMALNPAGQGAARSKLEEQIWALSRNLPKGFALTIEQDVRIRTGNIEMATASGMRVTELTRTKLPASAMAIPAGLTPTNYMAYMMREMERQRR